VSSVFLFKQNLSAHFSGMTVWVTGASSGIGAALCRALAHNGARVVLSARRQSKLIEVRDSCTNPDLHRIVVMDVASEASIEKGVREVLKSCAQVDVLINNAGISQRSPAIDTQPEVLERLLQVNTLGTISLTQKVLPQMLSLGRGQVVIVSSVLGRIGAPHRSSYAASKHALHGYFESLRSEIEQPGVSISIVCPGYVHTEISLHALTAQGEPFGRNACTPTTYMEPDACALAILRGVAQRKAEFNVGGRETLGIAIFRLLPGLYRWLIRRMKQTHKNLRSV